MYPGQIRSRVRPNILRRIVCRLYLIDSLGSYGRTRATHQFLNGDHLFKWYEYELNKLTHRLVFTQKEMRIKNEILIKVIGSRDNQYDLSDSLGSLYYTENGIAYYISISEAIGFRKLFVFVNKSGVEGERGEGFNISQWKLNKIIKQYSR